jgi:hypothetical protein
MILRIPRLSGAQAVNGSRVKRQWIARTIKLLILQYLDRSSATPPLPGAGVGTIYSEYTQRPLLALLTAQAGAGLDETIRVLTRSLADARTTPAALRRTSWTI